ncbi:hypothetical protein ACWC0C_41660 [Streptomyces sp. NPDC001709]
MLAVLLRRGGGTRAAFAHTSAWTTLFTFLATGLALLLPAPDAQVAQARSRS